jgi:NDP-sugar pyrophosphorylase family protein
MIKLGRHSYACDPILRGNMNDVIVGNYSSIAQNNVFDCGFNHNIKNVTTFTLNKLDGRLPGNIKNRGDIVVGNDVTIGENCIIMSGVTIGNGAVIGAGTVVRRNVPPYTVVTDCQYYFRFPVGQILQLEQIAWWNWDDERILANAHLLLSEDIDNFIKNHI